VSTLTSQLQYRFSNPELLTQALTHRSHHAKNNERLEFLGDGVLNFIIAHQLYSRFPDLPEGDLSRLRALLVKEATLSELANQFELGKNLKLGEGEMKSAGWRRPSILADALEAIIGAAYLDGGFAAAEQCVLQFFHEKLNTINPKAIDKDAKSLLQELLQSRKVALPVYTVTDTAGEAHAQHFEVSCVIEKYAISTVGAGTSRRIAEQQAAQHALDQLEKSGIRIVKK
jgi:ribonuclease-3